MKLGKKVKDSEKPPFLYQRRDILGLKLRVANAVKKRRETPEICRGPKAENLVRVKLEEHGVLTFKGPENHVDIVGLKVEGDQIKFPLEALGVEVLNFTMHACNARMLSFLRLASFQFVS